MTNLIPLSESQIESMVVTGLGDVFETMLHGTVELQSSQHLEANDEEVSSPLSHIDETLVVGNVGFVGKISGMVYIAMPESLAKEIAKIMLGMDDEDLEGEHEMINDVIGEITNMCSGAYKNQMSDMGFPCRLTIPSIIRGKYFVVEAAKAAYRQIFLFKFRGSMLSFELIMKVNDNGGE